MIFFIITIDDVTVFDFASKAIVPLTEVSASCLLPNHDVANLVLEQHLLPLLSNDDLEKVRIFGSVNPNIIIDGVNVQFEKGRISTLEYTDIVEETRDAILFTNVKAGLPLADVLENIDITRLKDYHIHIIHTVDGEDIVSIVEKGIDIYDEEVANPFSVTMTYLATGDVDSVKARVGTSVRRLKNPSFKNYSFQLSDRFNIRLRVEGQMISDSKFSVPVNVDLTDKNTWYHVEQEVKVSYVNGMGVVTLNGLEIDQIILRDSLTYRSFVNECEKYMHSSRFINLTGIVFDHVDESGIKPLPTDDPFNGVTEEPVVEEPVVEEPVVEEPKPVVEEPIATEPPVEEPVVEEPVVEEPIATEPPVEEPKPIPVD